MEIKKGKIITLENDKEYYIINVLHIKSSEYLYMCSLSLDEERDIFFSENKDGKLHRVQDDNILKDLLLLVGRGITT